jgi:hypothetical protein
VKVTRVLILLLLFVLVTSTFAQREREDIQPGVPLRNWAVDFSPLTLAPAGTSEGRIAATAVPSAASHFITMVPCRIVDTRRTPDGPFDGPVMLANETRNFDLNSGPCTGIPADVAAYSLNITAASPTDRGHFRAWPTGQARPLISTLNYQPGENIANAAVVPAGVNGSVDVYTLAQTHLVIDINGYFVEGVVTAVTEGSAIDVSASTGNVTISLQPESVTSAHLAADSVTSSEIALSAVGSEEIGFQAVTTEEIANLTILEADIRPGAITASRLAALLVRKSLGVTIDGGSPGNGDYATASQTASCDTNDRLISWGAEWSPTPPANEELPITGVTFGGTTAGANPTNVTVTAGNDSGTDYVFRAVAVCLNDQ